ncbi:uncharacterized [Tachysurus ichikawai]
MSAVTPGLRLSVAIRQVLVEMFFSFIWCDVICLDTRCLIWPLPGLSDNKPLSCSGGADLLGSIHFLK